ncbi:MAG: sterol desaturase family protein [Planctomycetes bacterium]|nr:sterol desaturase family protein [Planctomycetota bacterium]
MMLGIDNSVLVFASLVLVFETLERVRPAREIDRWKDLKIDVASFALAVAMNRACDWMISAWMQDNLPERLVASMAAVRELPAGVKILLALVCADFTIYWIHRAQHRFDTLWRTHAWHHSIEEMYWFAGFRTSFAHSFLYNIPQATIPMLFFGLGTFEASVAFAIGMVVQFWEHTNLRVDIGPLAYVFITPQYHRVHHSASELCRTNYGATFSVWDRAFKTFVDPRSLEAGTPLGLGEPLVRRRVPRMIVGV